MFALIAKPNVVTLRNFLAWILQVEDTGRYTCLASSPAGDDDKEYLVRVHGKFGRMFALIPKQEPYFMERGATPQHSIRHVGASGNTCLPNLILTFD